MLSQLIAVRRASRLHTRHLLRVNTWQPSRAGFCCTPTKLATWLVQAPVVRCFSGPEFKGSGDKVFPWTRAWSNKIFTDSPVKSCYAQVPNREDPHLVVEYNTCCLLSIILLSKCIIVSTGEPFGIVIYAMELMPYLIITPTHLSPSVLLECVWTRIRLFEQGCLFLIFL